MHRDIHAHAHLHRDTYMHVHVHTYAYLHVHTHTYAYMHTHTQFIYVHMHKCTSLICSYLWNKMGGYHEPGCIILTPLCLMVYGGCNYLGSQSPLGGNHFPQHFRGALSVAIMCHALSLRILSVEWFLQTTPCSGHWSPASGCTGISEFWLPLDILASHTISVLLLIYHFL